jgi:tRNA 2-thiouridine synthesizing protein A
MPHFKINSVLDMKSLKCPKPMIKVMNTLKSMEKGQILQVICDDKTSKKSIPSLCKRGDYKLLSLGEQKEVIKFIIRR